MKIKRILSDRGVALDVGRKEIDNLVSNLSNIKIDTRDTDQNQISKLTNYRVSHKKVSTKNFYSELLKASVHSFKIYLDSYVNFVWCII